MRWLRRFTQRALSEKRLESELQFHIEQSTESDIAQGIPPAEARRRAVLEFVGVERFKEERRENHWEHQWDIAVRDFHFALGCLRKVRRFAFIAIFALALGIG